MVALRAMALIREIGIAVLIVIITLWLQSAGLAALIHWVRHALASDAHRLGPVRSAVLVGGQQRGCCRFFFHCFK